MTFDSFECTIQWLLVWAFTNSNKYVARYVVRLQPGNGGDLLSAGSRWQSVALCRSGVQTDEKYSTWEFFWTASIRNYCKEKLLVHGESYFFSNILVCRISCYLLL